MTLAIVILNWNGRHLLETFLPSVLQYSNEGTVYVVDNASTDDSVVFLHTHFPEVSVIENPSNNGYAGGYNRALSLIKADIYCLLNSDVRVSSGWLSPVLHAFADESIAIVQPKIRDEKRPSYFEYAGAAGGFIDKYGFPYCKGRIFDTIEEDLGQYNESFPIPIFWASGACFFIRAEVFHQLGGFDEDFFAHQEEIDLCWRAHHLSKKVVCTTDSIVYHVGGATLSVQSPRKTYLNFRNRLFMLLKNLPYNSLYTTLFLRMVLDGVAGVRFLLQGKPRFTWEIIKAHFHFYASFKRFKKKRPSTLITNYYQKKSIVWEYFFFSSKAKNKLNFQK